MTNPDLPELALSFDIAVYRLAAIKKAAYKFGDRCFVRIKTVGEHEAEITLTCKSQAVDLSRLAGDFSNEVLDQELRELLMLALTTERPVQPCFDNTGLPLVGLFTWQCNRQ
jgi:His-Xaa-Ser system protein HxsD